MALAAVVGLVIGVALAFFIEYLDTSVKTLDDAESVPPDPGARGDSEGRLRC